MLTPPINPRHTVPPQVIIKNNSNNNNNGELRAIPVKYIFIDFAGGEGARTLATFGPLVDAGALRVRNVTQVALFCPLLVSGGIRRVENGLRDDTSGARQNEAGRLKV